MKNMISGLLKLTLILLWTTSYSAESSDIKIFNVADYKNIVSQQNNEFVMLFWSIDCSPCIKEMRSISALSKKQRSKFVFISTDGDEFKQEVSNVLTRLDLEKEQNWVFSSASTDDIINAVDNSWYGETPRSYYFDKEKNRTRLFTR